MNDISEQELDAKFRLSEDELSEIWDRIETGLGRGRRRGGFVRWSIAATTAAAAIILGLFLTLSDNENRGAVTDKIAETVGNSNADNSSAATLTDNVSSDISSNFPSNVSSKLSATEQDDIADATPSYATTSYATTAPVLTAPVTATSVAATSITTVPVTARSVTTAPEFPTSATRILSTIAENSARPETEENPSVSRTETEPKKPDKKSRTKKAEKEYYADEYYSTGKRRFALSASSDMTRRGDLGTSTNSYIKSVASKVHFVAPGELPLIEPISERTNYFPLNFAVQGSYRISDKLTIGAGISYSYLHSKFDGLINKQAYSIKQDIHYVGIPVNLYIGLTERGNFDFYANVGGSVEKGVRLRYEMKTYDRNKSLNSHIKGLQYSLNGGLGVEYRFGSRKQTGIYIEPNAVYYFDSKAPGSIRTEQPLQIEAEIGIRIHLK